MMVEEETSPIRDQDAHCIDLEPNIMQQDLSFDGSENTNVFVEEFLQKTHRNSHPLTSLSINRPPTGDLLMTRRRLSIGTTFGNINSARQTTTSNNLFPPICPEYNHRPLKINDYDALRQLAPQDQAQEWWKMLYGEKSEHRFFTNTPRSAPSKSCLSSTKKKRQRDYLTPNTCHVSKASGGTDTPLRNCSRSVKFGSASAAEFEENDPPQGSLTPMPSMKAAQRYPTDFKEPDQETADLIAMTKENSATLAEWDFFDDDNDEETLNSKRTLRNNRRSRRESGRFTPLMEAESFDTTGTKEQVSNNTVEEKEDDDDYLVKMSSTASQLFSNLAISIQAVRQTKRSSQNETNNLERQILECSDPSCCGFLEESLSTTLACCPALNASIIDEKRIQYQMRSHPALAARIMARANFQFCVSFIESLESSKLVRIRKQIEMETRRVSNALLSIEKACRTNVFHAIAREKELVRSLQKSLLKAKIQKEELFRRKIENQLLCQSTVPLTYYVMNYISPFRLVDSSYHEIKVEFRTRIEKRSLQLTIDLKEEILSFHQMDGINDGSTMHFDTVATMSETILAATCKEMEVEYAIPLLPLPIIIHRVAQVLYRLDQYLDRFITLFACYDDVSVSRNGHMISIFVQLPDRTKVEFIYNLSGPLLQQLHTESIRPTVSIHRNEQQVTDLPLALLQFLNHTVN